MTSALQAMPARARALAPGLLISAAGASLGYLAHHFWSVIQPGTVAVALGALAVNAGMIRPFMGPGLTYASKRLLRVAVALLGFSLSWQQIAALGLPTIAVVVATVSVAFFGTLLLARMLKVRKETGLLVATGFSICGASAIAAAEPIVKAKKDDTAMAVALVTLCGSLAIAVLPLLRHPIGFDDPAVFGQWVGASVHDVGQTVATASIVDGALQNAVIVKLARVMLLAVLLLGLGLAMVRGRTQRPREARRTPVMPLFVAMFIAAIAVNSLVSLPAPLLEVVHRLHQILITVALFALGTGIHWLIMKRAGGRPLVLGLLSWVLIAVAAYAGVALIN